MLSMRWQRLSISDCIQSGDWRAAWSRLAPSFGTTLCLVAAASLLLVATPAPAESDEVVAGGEVTSEGELPERGMPASNTRVKSILASRPGELLTICVAGCGKPVIVQALPKPIERRSAAMRTTAGGASRPGYGSADRDSVLCIGGCAGRPGQAVQRLPGLPPLKAEQPAEAEPNEPLDVVR